MLVICTKTGLTYARKVHREGEIFMITGRLEREYKDLSNEAWNRKQKRTYSGVVAFRQPTSDEIVAAIRDKKLDPGSASVRMQLSKKQLRIALDYAESKEAKKLKAIQMLKEGLDMEIEDAPKEKAKVIWAPKRGEEEAPEEEAETPEKEVEAPAEELVEAPEKPAEKVPEEEVEAPEKPAEKVPEEESEPEELELVEAPEKVPEKESEAPPEEPVKEPEKKESKKKDKKKDK